MNGGGIATVFSKSRESPCIPLLIRCGLQDTLLAFYVAILFRGRFGSNHEPRPSKTAIHGSWLSLTSQITLLSKQGAHLGPTKKKNIYIYIVANDRVARVSGW